jgi:hypothetical protein
MPSELTVTHRTSRTYRATRRAYELGRLAMAVRRAGFFTLGVAVMSAALCGRESLVWLPVTFTVVALTEWRGGLLVKGARRGLFAGVASMVLPLSLLRPCCGLDAKAMGTTCCTMPSVCWAAGGAVGLAVALLMPVAPAGRRSEAALGLVLGVTSVALVRCSMLFVGEAAGLLGGMAAGIVASSLARAWLGGRRSLA